LVIAIGLAAIPTFTRLVRASFLSLKDEEFVTAALAVGASSSRIIFRHILPNSLASLLVQTTYSIAGAILTASGLSFLGLGAQPPAPEWGVMLSRCRDYMRLAPHVVTVPGLVIAISILGLNLLGDGLRDILDPRLID
jgi:peptide/nickel transport system permease protein